MTSLFIPPSDPPVVPLARSIHHVRRQNRRLQGKRFRSIASISRKPTFFPQTSEILTALAAVFEGYNADEKAAQLKKVRAPRVLP